MQKLYLVATGLLTMMAALALSPALSASVPVPEVMPYCPSPQATAPLQGAGGSGVYAKSPVVWNGKDYASVWVDDTTGFLTFRRFFADGTPAGAPRTLFSAFVLDAPALVWNGTGYGVAYVHTSGTYRVILFARLGTDGQVIGSPVQVSFYGSTATANCYTPALAWSGSGYAVAWADGRAGSRDIYETLLDADGAVAGSGAYHDTGVGVGANDQMKPTLVWSSGIGRYILAYEDLRNGGNLEISLGSITPTNMVGWHGILISGSGNSSTPFLAVSTGGIGLAWSDSRDGNHEVYFAALSATGTKIGSDVRLTNAPSRTDTAPVCVWTGAEYGVFWESYESGRSYLWFQRVSAAGVAQGDSTQVTLAADVSAPGAAFGRFGYLVTGGLYSLTNYVQAWGCNYPDTPSCPGGFVAYNITGTSATIGWLPAGSAYTDIAYYIVYRNAVPIAMTSDAFYTDSGLAPNASYAYAVQPVNAAQNQNYTCQTTFYVKSNATLILKVNKGTNGNDADLTWTDASMNSYNVFRSTDPRVMNPIGSTAGQNFTDPNALTNGNLYFYTVDEPGW